MKPEKKLAVFKTLFSRMEFFDSPSREFELPSITFQALTSAASFAQLKRHRIATLLSTDLQPELGNTIPENIIKTGLEKEFLEVIKRTNTVYNELKEKYGPTADYILTNSHRKMVIMKMNLRELYHFIRLRDDEHAQWDIKKMAQVILKKVKKLMPLSTLMLCGKSDFVDCYEKIYQTKPKFEI
jgi:thymidylate synthase ThyX